MEKERIERKKKDKIERKQDKKNKKEKGEIEGIKKRIKLSRPMMYPEVINKINYLFHYYRRWTDYTMYPWVTDREMDKPFCGIQVPIPPQKKRNRIQI